MVTPGQYWQISVLASSWTSRPWCANWLRGLSLKGSWDSISHSCRVASEKGVSLFLSSSRKSVALWERHSLLLMDKLVVTWQFEPYFNAREWSSGAVCVLERPKEFRRGRLSCSELWDILCCPCKRCTHGPCTACGKFFQWPRKMGPGLDGQNGETVE